MTAAKVSTISTPAPARVAEAYEIRLIAVSSLRAAEWNPRKTVDPVELTELVDSVKAAGGILVPLLVRPHVKQFRAVESSVGGKVWYVESRNVIGKYNIIETHSHRSAEENRAAAEKDAAERNGNGDYEIVAGHRRAKAAELCGYADVPCIVRELTDDEARDLALVDNLQRVGVPAMEEAEAFADLLKRHGSIGAVAMKVGKEVGYVAKRLKLCTLGEQPRRALAERLITIDHALLLAPLGDAEQDANLKWCLDTQASSKMPVAKVIDARIKRIAADRDDKTDFKYRCDWQPETPLRLKERIGQQVDRPLTRAPWLLDQQLIGADGNALPLCDGCASNTKANSSLFSDLEFEEATCADGACFARKADALVLIRLADAGAVQHGPNGENAVRVSWKQTSTKPRMNKEGSAFNLFQTFKAGQWIEAKPKSCEHVRAAVTVDWSDANDRGYMGGRGKLRKPGEIVTVCVAEKCKAHPKAWEKAAAANRSTGGGYDAKAEEEKREKARLAALAETKLRARLAGEAIERVNKLPVAILRDVLKNRLSQTDEEIGIAILPGFAVSAAKAAIDSPQFAKVVALAFLTSRYVKVFEHWPATQYRKEFIAELGRLGYDASKAWDKPKVDQGAPAKAAKKQPLSAETKKRVAVLKKRVPKAARKGGAK